MPEPFEIRTAKEIGKTGRCKYIWLICELCKEGRWTRYNYAKKKDFKLYCSQNSCASKMRSQIVNENNPKFWDGIGIPIIGMVTRAKTVGFKGRSLVVYDKCPECDKLFWRFKQSVGKRCQSCEATILYSSLRGELNGQWKGGRRLTDEGYIMLTIQPDDSCYPMSDHGKIYEHRYMYANEVAHRLLEEWEIVHHVNHIRDDNRIDNFTLEDRVTHFPDNMLVKAFNKLMREHKDLQSRVIILEAENVLLKKQIEDGILKT